MIKKFTASTSCLGTLAIASVFCGACSSAPTDESAATSATEEALLVGKTLPSNTKFSLRAPDSTDPAIAKQIETLLTHHDVADGLRLLNMQLIPQATWLTGGTPEAVSKLVKQTVAVASDLRQVPVLVPYNIPGRDCGGYSAGGAQTTAAYQAWINAIASAIGNKKAVLILEPDALANLPSDCGYDTTGSLTADRYTQISYAITTLEALPNTLVYLDAGHSQWHSVGDMAQRLVQAGVGNTQGFYLNVSNFQPTPQLEEFGTWISECIYFAAQTDWRQGHYDYCASEYYPANPSDFSTWALTDAWYTSNVFGQANPPTDLSKLTHFVIDTSRNGASTGNAPPKVAMDVYGAAPYNQSSATVSTLENGSWCNPPGAGLGARPTANTGNVMIDALLWIKTPGQSDGACAIQGGARAWDYSVYTKAGWPTAADQTSGDAAYQTFDPVWGLKDPAAGLWFPQQAIQLAQLANPALF